MLSGLDLFSGIGGNSLALKEWVNTLAYCETDRHAQAILLSRMREGKLPSRPIWDDVRTLRGFNLPPVDIIIGGFPCQDISVAGKGEGLEGERSGLFFEIVRLAEEIKPTFLFLENVPAIRTRGLDRAIQELTALGYDLRWTMLSAEEVGAPHKRNRWFCLATHAERLELRLKQGRSGGTNGQGTTELGVDGAQGPMAYADGVWEQSNQDSGRKPFDRTRDSGAHEPRSGKKRGSMADSECHRLQRSIDSEPGEGTPDVGRRFTYPCLSTFEWAIEPDVGRVAHGVPFRVDRIKRLGNAVVPLQAREAFKELMGLINLPIKI